MEKIEMVDLKRQYVRLKDKIDANIQQVIKDTSFIKGPMVTSFQEHLAHYLGVKHVIGVGNGTDALQIALMALGLKPGDEVITPTFTFIATAEVVALLGLTPVLVDVRPDTFTIDVEAVKKAITSRTKAIVPVHLFGQNADMEPLLALAKEHELFVIEDACQSIGSKYTFSDGCSMFSGCMGDIGCTSFFPSKNLGCYGDGGALFTNNDELAVRIRSIANHGMEVRYHHDCIGVNSRLDSLQAAVLEAKLPQLDDFTARRQHAAHYYNEAFKDSDYLVIPQVGSQTNHVYHQYTLQLRGVDRTLLQQGLMACGIPAMIYYPIPLHMQKAYMSSRYREGDFPVAEMLSQCVLSLPMHTELDEEQLAYIVGCVNQLLETSRIK